MGLRLLEANVVFWKSWFNLGLYFTIIKQKEGKMKNYKLIFIVFVLISYYIIGLPTQIIAQTNDGDQLRLEGLELAKGVDLTIHIELAPYLPEKF